MSAAQLTFPRFRFSFDTRTALRLCIVERILLEERILDPVPSRQTLINWIEEGRLAGKKTDIGWIVYQDALEAFVRRLQVEAA